ncbi:MAG: hypothetical protein HN353_04670 [Bdellovibrionales bacterium]|jgi:flagellar motility protein MotE (MotC chaperone)|nr:hypothetical protein [Bdellovibrionales bacterium]MBT3527421.1 hypothetical protein [Bdellovibrionales bacterium]MBT7669118.1 hypothetical protein [Bdellovibrionales bacterium]MBT7766926.1 hypothetical protein [Bdellovibrionales bacterium]
MKYLVSLVITSLLLLPLGWGQDKVDPDNPDKKEENSKEVTSGAEQKIYTERELKAEIKERVGKKMRQLGQGKIVNFAQELMEKEEQLAVQQLEVRKEKEQFKQSIQSFEVRVKSFEKRQQKLLGCIQAADKKENRRIDHMVEVISGMKPMSAAQVLSVQDAEITIKILGKLSPPKVSKIFNLMDKEISARLQKQYLTMKR